MCIANNTGSPYVHSVLLSQVTLSSSRSRAPFCGLKCKARTWTEWWLSQEFLRQTDHVMFLQKRFRGGMLNRLGYVLLYINYIYIGMNSVHPGSQIKEYTQWHGTASPSDRKKECSG